MLPARGTDPGRVAMWRIALCASNTHFQPGRGSGELSPAAFFLGRDPGFDNDLLRLYRRRGNSARTMAHRSQARHPARCGQVCADFSRRGHRERSSRHADSARRRYRSSLRRSQDNLGLAGQRCGFDRDLCTFSPPTCGAAGNALVEPGSRHPAPGKGAASYLPPAGPGDGRASCHRSRGRVAGVRLGGRHALSASLFIFRPRGVACGSSWFAGGNPGHVRHQRWNDRSPPGSSMRPAGLCRACNWPFWRSG